MKNKILMRSNVVRSLIFILMPILVSFIMYGRMVMSLQSYMEEQVTEQAAALGELALQRLSEQLDELERVAGYYQDSMVSEEVMGSSLDQLLASSSRISCGVLTLGGIPVYGNELRASEYPAVRRAFRGYSTVRYREETGLLFTVPVYNDNNIKYILYEFCEEKDLFSNFGENCYDGQAQLILAEGIQRKIISISEDWEGTGAFASQAVMQEVERELKEKLNNGTSAAVCYGSRENKEFLFVSEIGRGNLYVIGQIPYSVVAGNISTLSGMTLLVFALLLVLLCIGTFSMFNASAKAKESDALREAKQAAEEADKSKGKFLANMSHELRTPINVILGMDEMILRENIEDTTRERAMDIKSAAQILMGLINDVLDFSRIEAGNLKIIPVEYDLVAMIRDLVLLSENRARQKSLNFEMEIQPDLPIGLYGDDIHIRQVMINLLTNAVKYTEEGNVTLKLTGEKKDDDRLVMHCAVKDTGIGIKEEDLKKLFVPFSRVEEKRNRYIEGSGLGLSIIINLLRLMGSKLDVESVYGEGSVFSFDLEQKIVDPEPIGDIRKRLEKMVKEYKYQVSFVAPDAHILMVDDNSMNRRLFVSLLNKTEIQITTASSGKKALELVQKQHFDLIFMDYLMPEMDGGETLICLRNLENNMCKDTPVIALTANAFNSAKEHYMNMGFDGFLSKPIVSEKLEALIWEMLPKEYVQKAAVEKPESVQEEEKPSKEVEEELPAIEGVNWKYAQLYLKDREILLYSLRHFYKIIDSTVQEITSLAERLDIEETVGENAAGDAELTANDEAELMDEMEATEETEYEKRLKDYRIRVHGLKSTTASLGILSLSELAKLLEYAARDGEADKVRRATPLLIDELNKTKERLRPFMEEPDTNSPETVKPGADAAKLCELFEMLRFSMEKMDIGGTDICMNQICSYSYEEKLQNVVDQVSQFVTNLDYDSAQEQIQQFVKECS